MNKHRVLIDLDHVIFNTSLLRKNNLQFFKSDRDEKYIYEDAKQFLLKHNSNFSFTLFSEGDKSFQKDKIQNSKLDKLIKWERIIIKSPLSKASELKTLYSSGYHILIDDRPNIIEKAVEIGFYTIRVRRGKYEKIKTKIKPDLEVLNLNKLALSDVIQTNVKS